MDLPIIGSSYRTHTQSKNGISSRMQKTIILKIHPFIKENEDYEEKHQKTRCDKAGKNKTLKENCTKTFEKTKFEFTSPGTPHKDGVLEREFVTLYSWVRAMMARTGLHENLKTSILTEYTATKTKLETIVVKPKKEKCAHEKFYGNIPDCKKILRTFGETEVVRSINTVK